MLNTRHASCAENATKRELNNVRLTQRGIPRKTRCLYMRVYKIRVGPETYVVCADVTAGKGRKRLVGAIDSLVNSRAESKLGFSW